MQLLAPHLTSNLLQAIWKHWYIYNSVLLPQNKPAYHV